MNQEERGKKMQQIIAKCWADEGFKQKLLADPAATLAAEGAAIPAGLAVKAVENTDTLFHLVIPPKPSDLSDEDLDKVAGGFLRAIEDFSNVKGESNVPSVFEGDKNVWGISDIKMYGG